MCYQRQLTICAVILVCVAIFGAANENNLEFVAECDGNRAFKGEAIESPNTAYSATECGIRCCRLKMCRSFTFNEYSRLCHLSSGRVETCNHLTEESGSTYMKAVSYCTSLYHSFSLSMLLSSNEYLCHEHADNLLFSEENCI